MVISWSIGSAIVGVCVVCKNASEIAKSEKLLYTSLWSSVTSGSQIQPTFVAFYIIQNVIYLGIHYIETTKWYSKTKFAHVFRYIGTSSVVIHKLWAIHTLRFVACEHINLS